MRHLRLCPTRKILNLKYQTLNLAYQIPRREDRMEVILYEFFTLIPKGRSQVRSVFIVHQLKGRRQASRLMDYNNGLNDGEGRK